MHPKGVEGAIADIRLFSLPLVASADAKSPCVAAQMMQKSHITKEKGDCPQAVPQKKIPNYIDSLSSAMRFSTCSAFC